MQGRAILTNKQGLLWLINSLMIFSYLGFPRQNRANDECIPQLSDETVSSILIVVSMWLWVYSHFSIAVSVGRNSKAGKIHVFDVLRNTRTRCKICSKLTIKTSGRRLYFTPCSSVSIVNFEYVIVGWIKSKSMKFQNWNLQ